LFIQTEEALWKVDPSRNIVPTDEQSIYIGTGDFFSNEVQEIIESDTGYLGTQSQWALLINISDNFPIHGSLVAIGGNTEVSGFKLISISRSSSPQGIQV